MNQQTAQTQQVTIEPVTANDFFDTLDNAGIKPANYSDCQVVVGFADGVVFRTQTVVGALRDIVIRGDVILFDIRPYGYMNQPESYEEANASRINELEMWGSNGRPTC